MYTLITGAAKRIGKEIATTLAKNSHNIIIHYNRSKEEAIVLQKEIMANYKVEVILVKADLTNKEEVINLIKNINSKGITINNLINNASTFIYDNFLNFNEEDFNTNFMVNFTAPLLLSKEFYNQAKSLEEANIINIVDHQIEVVIPRFMSYNIAKTALWQLTQIMAITLAPSVRVNAIAPGLTMKPLDMPQERFAEMADKTLLKKPVNPKDIALTTLYILENKSLTGELIKVNCGGHLRPKTIL